MNNLLKQCLWLISFQYDFEKLLSLLYQVFKSTLKLKKVGTDRMNECMNDRMTTKDGAKDSPTRRRGEPNDDEMLVNKIIILSQW